MRERERRLKQDEGEVVRKIRKKKKNANMRSGEEKVQGRRVRGDRSTVREKVRER